MFLAAEGLPTLQTTVAVLVGGALSAGGANTLNSVYDRDIDALMHRTEARPAAVGSISVRAGVIQGVVLSLLSAVILAWLTNWLAAALSLVAVLMYVLGYTMILKRRTSQNIVWGGAAGCMPVLIAWSAVTGGMSMSPVILFLIVFFWTPPHFWALSLLMKDDYAAAGIPMLPVVRGEDETRRQILLYSVLLYAVSQLPFCAGGLGVPYLVVSLGLGLTLIVMAWQLRRRADRASALKLYLFSLLYLAALFAAMVVDVWL